jgi:KDO2-lipid IV(A) lauroyltransferase
MRHIGDWIGVFTFWKLRFFVFLLPRSWCLRLGRLLGTVIFLLDRKHRRITLANLKTAFGEELPPKTLRKISRLSFRHFGEFILDIMNLARYDEEKRNRLFVIEGEEHLRQALLEGKGALLFSGHYGNWEVATHVLSRMGKLNVIARPLDNDRLEKELLKLRARLGASVISKFRATKPILHALRQNEMVAILIDLNVLRSQGIFVDFFGKKASTTPSLAAFYLRTHSPLIPVFCYPIGSQRYQVKILKPLDIHLQGNKDEDLLKITQLCTKIIEHQIRKNPVYWFWFHKRWKSRPEGETTEPEGRAQAPENR